MTQNQMLLALFKHEFSGTNWGIDRPLSLATDCFIRQIFICMAVDAVFSNPVSGNFSKNRAGLAGVGMEYECPGATPAQGKFPCSREKYREFPGLLGPLPRPRFDKSVIFRFFRRKPQSLVTQEQGIIREFGGDFLALGDSSSGIAVAPELSLRPRIMGACQPAGTRQ